jgi:hypothetical protein
VIYKVSFVVLDDAHPGGIQNLDHQPVVGEELEAGGHRFEIVEVTELLPPFGDYSYLHVTCRLIDERHAEKGTDGDNA